MCATTKFNAEAWAGNRELAMIFHRRGDGFLKDCDLPELTKIDRLFPCLVRCGGCRFTCAVQDVSHLVGIIEASGKEYVRDIAMLMNPPPPKPGPYGTWEKAESEARSLNRAVEAGECGYPEDAAQTITHSAEVAAIPCGPSAHGNDWRARTPFTDSNGPTGHGDICYSDADPGL